ncbi:DUF4395 domain-containing protein [Paenibacillus doosanensis]|uniref:DUF4395 domain-containing protein n=1 Tax=Paenibacillus konkukensis TaxID=2020716 RepID=A0ABY4RGF3_9BACL|nr:MULTISPECIES: DUF4395 domain-containing protein [Paenibacillus]MCS7464697.1 DUF4395 domain-containing protein [Paenibacillus doosanensis]UQZ81549.1 hypothetical protein SK3146_00705 [Paenibacillus konkukensis]
MQEIPVPYVRANQAGIVLFILLAMLFRQPAFIVVLWAIQVIGLWQGARGNLFIVAAAPLLKGRIAGAATEARELQRFNNAIAVALLTVATLAFLANAHSIVGYIAAGMVAAAALAALCGYCVGCFLYYQFKKNFRRK